MEKIYLLLLTVFFSFSVYAQTKPIQGKVTDSQTGESIPGVNLIIKGTTNAITGRLPGVKIEGIKWYWKLNVFIFLKKMVPFRSTIN